MTTQILPCYGGTEWAADPIARQGDPDPRDPEWPGHADTLEEPHAPTP